MLTLDADDGSIPLSDLSIRQCIVNVGREGSFELLHLLYACNGMAIRYDEWTLGKPMKLGTVP